MQLLWQRGPWILDEGRWRTLGITPATAPPSLTAQWTLLSAWQLFNGQAAPGGIVAAEEPLRLFTILGVGL